MKHSVPVYKYALGIVLIFVIVVFGLKLKYPKFFEASSKTIRALVKNQMGLRTLPSWQSIGDGVDVLTLTSETENIPSGTNLFFIRFNSEKIQTFVLHDKGLSTAEKMARDTNALAVINASFFRPEGQPIGLIIQEGKITNKLPTRGLLDSGIFCIKNGRPYIIHRNYFQPSGITEAIQSFPRLIQNGTVVAQIAESDKRKRRSGIAIDAEGRIIIFISDTNLGGVRFKEIQKILLKPNLNVRSALALDGGGSSQLCVNCKQFTKVIHGMTEVPVFLGFFPK
ncbi:MAG: phosphodiester glycosidase family protein [Candidatus Zhuqueibacterota bacterium]